MNWRFRTFDRVRSMLPHGASPPILMNETRHHINSSLVSAEPVRIGGTKMQNVKWKDDTIGRIPVFHHVSVPTSSMAKADIIPRTFISNRWIVSMEGLKKSYRPPISGHAASPPVEVGRPFRRIFEDSPCAAVESVGPDLVERHFRRKEDVRVVD